MTSNNTKRFLFHSYGKLLLTGEYLVLSGAKALAVPLKKGQSMEVGFTPGKVTVITWAATDPDGLWFSAQLGFTPHLSVLSATDPLVARRLILLLNAARSLNPGFLTQTGAYLVNNQLTFSREWGWGSSSTLISNIAWWSGTDPFELNRLVSKGSGYDIACARSESALFYHLSNLQPVIEQAVFKPSFRNHLAFIWLGHKQDTLTEIGNFKTDQNIWNDACAEVSEISGSIAGTNDITSFNSLIDRHETIIGSILGRSPVKMQEFRDFNGSVKSLGAWGGDFIMASSEQNFEETVHYFKERGYPTVFSWNEIIR